MGSMPTGILALSSMMRYSHPPPSLPWAHPAYLLQHGPVMGEGRPVASEDFVGTRRSSFEPYGTVSGQLSAPGFSTGGAASAEDTRFIQGIVAAPPVGCLLTADRCELTAPTRTRRRGRRAG